MNKVLKIGSYNANIKRDLGIGIYEIEILYPKNILEEKFKEYEKIKIEKPDFIKNFQESLLRIGVKTDSEKAAYMNLKQVFKADRYFTNGHLMITVIEEDGLSYLYTHLFNLFTNFHTDYSFFTATSLKNKHPVDLVSDLKVDIEVIEILSKKNISGLPVLEDSQSYATIESSLEFGEKFIYQDIVFNSKLSDVDGRPRDQILQKFIDLVKPKTLKCCLNCKNFRFSGMSHDMSWGNTGYCQLLLDNERNREGVKDRITDIDLWCDNFDRK